VARLRGYDTFSDELRPARPGNVPDDPQWLTSRRVRDALVGAGLLETRPMPFVKGGEAFVRVTNPLAENEAYLRRELLDTLARRAEYNLARMEGNLRLFEIGSAFGGPAERTGDRPETAGVHPELPREELRVAVLLLGRRIPPHFTDPKSEDFERWATYDAWDAKAMAEAVANLAYPGSEIELEESRDALWIITIDGKERGGVKQLTLDAPVWASPAYGIELSLGLVESAQVAAAGQSALREPERPAPRPSKYVPLPTTPPSSFDLALSVPDKLTAAAVEMVMRQAAGELLERLELFDQYTGHGVEVGHRSLAWRLTFRHPDRTLRDKEMEGRRAKILGALADALNVRPRTT
jgi:phenylalanyl-tRNA synthetase beta chain